MKYLATFLLLSLWFAPMERCSEPASAGNPELTQYLRGEWSAYGGLNGTGVQKMIGLNVGSDGFIRITYYATTTPKEEKYRFTIDADGDIKIDAFDETIRVQQFSENEFKFYRPGSKGQKLDEFEQTLFVYNFKRGG